MGELSEELFVRTGHCVSARPGQKNSDPWVGASGGSLLYLGQMAQAWLGLPSQKKTNTKHISYYRCVSMTRTGRE